MMCPGCGKYLNSNVKECIYCGISIKREKGRAEINFDSAVKYPETSENKKPDARNNVGIIKKDMRNSKNKFFFIGLFAASLGILSIFVPWSSWTSMEYVISYNPADIANISWGDTIDSIKYYPMSIGILSAFAIVLLLLHDRNDWFPCLTFGIGLLGIISNFVFLFDIYAYTSMNLAYGFYIISLSSVLLMFSGLGLSEKMLFRSEKINQ